MNPHRNLRVKLRLVGLVCAFIPVAAFFIPAFLPAQTAPTVPSSPGRDAAVLHIDGLGKGSAPLDGLWQFHLGDNAAYALAQTPDATGANGWEQLTTNKTWGAQGHAAYVGYAWYRKHLSLSAAPGASPDFYLLIPYIDDIFQVYWNGRMIGHYGSMPPRASRPFEQLPQIVHLGQVNDGVLAIRVYKAPLVSFDSDQLGGLGVPPLAGSLESITTLKAADDYEWLRSRQYGFAVQALYSLVLVLSLLAWFRDHAHKVLLAMAAFSGAHLIVLFLDQLRFPVPHDLALGVMQPVLTMQDVGLWYLLFFLLDLGGNRGLARLTRAFAIASLTATCVDSLLMLLDWSNPRIAGPIQVADGICTFIFSLLQFYPLVILAYGLRKRLDSARWLVAMTAFSFEFVQVLRVCASQGARFTHWTFGTTLGAPLFFINGNAFTLDTITGTLLLLAILYAVYRYLQETSNRQSSLEQEFKSARELQRVLIPDSLPELPGYAVSSAYQPAQEVGGDFFQLIPLEGGLSGSALIVLGDVSGKGLRAAMAVSLIVGAVRALARFSPRPSELLAELNQRLVGRIQGGFATCIVVLLARDGRCVIASAGHPPPYVNRRSLTLPGALPIGLVAGAVYKETSMQLEPGDHFALYTDGLLEARSPTGEIFGFERLDELFARRPAAEEATEAAVRFGQEDDITVLTLTRLASGQQSTTQLSIPVFAGG